MKKKEHLRHMYSRTLQNYLVSYAGIVLMALALLSIAVAWLTANRMKAEEARLTESRLYTIAEDMESQIISMRQITLEIASMEEFSPEYFEENKYREVELLSLLEKFVYRSLLSDYFFIKYEGNQTIFTSSGTTMPLNLYLSERFPEADPEAVFEEIDIMCGENQTPFSVIKEGGTALFIYPLQRYASGENGMEGVLCFEVTEKGLNDRAEQIAGKMEGELSIYYGEMLLVGSRTDNEAVYIERMSDSEMIRAGFSPDERSYFFWGNILSGREWIMLGTIALILFLVAVFAAYKSYRPIRQIVEKYKKTMGDNLEYDLDSIDHLISRLLQKEEENSDKLQQQYHLLREQTLRLIAQGGYSEGMKERLELLNIHLNAPVICRFSYFFNEQGRTEKMDKMIHQDIEDLSDDGTWLYSFWVKKDNLEVIAAIGEEYQAEEVQESLQSLFEAKGYRGQIRRVELCHDLYQLGNGENLHSEENDKKADFVSNQEEILEKVSGNQKSTAMLAMKYIEENCTKYDLSLELVAKEFNITSTYLCRLLKQQMGVSYKEYLTGLRINEAKRMLQKGNASVADVCIATGYTNVSYFIKVFQKYTGVTPAKYRDEN